VAGERVHVTASLGVSRLHLDQTNPEAAVTRAMRRADQAMYSVKGTRDSFSMDPA
jgi:GGDEF domain-containing protein